MNYHDANAIERTHRMYMQRCLELAKNGLGTTYPNPMVGSVIVHQGLIIGEGWHQKAGEAHAEVNAVAAVKDCSLLADSTLYVSLEPCSHFGKTPPCTNLILDCGIPNIVIGTIDLHHKVAGSGIAKLKAAGRNVTIGVLESECRQMNRRFFTFQQKRRPYIILKWAQSADGFMAPLSKPNREPAWISNEFSRQLTHKWRTEEQAILVGTNTAKEDNPALTARNWNGKNPVRILIDKSNQVSKESYIFDDQAPTLVFSEQEFLYENKNIVVIPIDFNREIMTQILAELYERDLQSVIVEGGRHTLQTFINEGLWDEARIFKSTTLLLQKGIIAPDLIGHLQHKRTIENDELLILRQHDQHDYF